MTNQITIPVSEANQILDDGCEALFAARDRLVDDLVSISRLEKEIFMFSRAVDKFQANVDRWDEESRSVEFTNLLKWLQMLGSVSRYLLETCC